MPSANGAPHLHEPPSLKLRAAPTLASPAWRDRIVALQRIPARQLMDHPHNWRTHPATQQTALAGLLAEVGQAAALLVYHSERHGGLVVIDGHLRRSMDIEASW